MRFDVEKLKSMARPMNESERSDIEQRELNRDWQALSAKFSLLVRHILRTEGIPETELAKRMNMSIGHVSEILSGKENLALSTIVKVEKALGRHLVTIDDNSNNSNLRSVSDLNQALPYSYYKEPETIILNCGEPDPDSSEPRESGC